MVPVETNILISSNPLNGARSSSSDGSSFEINLQNPLSIPKNAQSVSVSMEESTIWWTVPNIKTGVNDKVYITGLNKNDIVTNFVVTIPAGLYNLTGLETTILRGLSNLEAKDGLFEFQPDEATQRVSLKINIPGTTIDFTPNDTPREILGFNSAVVPDNTLLEILAPNTAAFNSIDYFVIHSDLVSNGIRLNDGYTQALGSVLINVLPGSQIVQTPFNPPRISANELAGSQRSSLRFWLTDDKNRLVDTNGEYWSARIVIRYYM